MLCITHLVLIYVITGVYTFLHALPLVTTSMIFFYKFVFFLDSLYK